MGAVTPLFLGTAIAVCTGQFFVTGSSKPAFAVIFVDRGNELRTTSLIPGVIVNYPSFITPEKEKN